ncbi:secreted protein, partial [marine sediment metagenome]
MLAKLKNSAKKNPLTLALLLALGTIGLGATASQQALAQPALSSVVT